MTLTHASFFSGAGGLDMGLERVGWTTVSFSEIDAYASAVLATRWPGIPNLGSITDLAGGRSGVGSGEQLRQHAGDRPDAGTHGAWTVADLWSGGFPCQDLSVAGKRRGMGTDTDRLDTRSGLAYAFLDLVERYRPPAIILENVPGLLSSHRGRDFYALQRRMAELGYVGAYRVLDARYFGVPQRRRRVFIVALDARRGATEDDAAEVLSVGSRCDRHPATGGQAGPGVADRAAPGVDIARAVTGSSGKRHDDDTDTLIAETVRSHPRPGSNSNGSLTVVSTSPDPDGVRAPDGLAGRLDDRAGVALVKGKRAQSVEDDESWREGDVAPTLNSFDVGDARTTVAVLAPRMDPWRHDFDPEPGSGPDGATWCGYCIRPDSDPLHGPAVVANALRASDGHHGHGSPRGDGGDNLIVNALDTMQGGADDNDAQAGRLVEVAPTLLAPGPEGGRRDKIPQVLTGPAGDDDPLLPDGLDSHRYRCCGNGVVAPVAEFVGERLRAVLERMERVA